jgi:membrane protease YdiL (CAAX protease family)
VDDGDGASINLATPISAHAQRPDQDSRGLALILGAGACYLAAAIARGPLLALVFDVPANGAQAFIQRNALQLQLYSFGILLPAIALLCVEALRADSLVRRSFNIRRRSFAYAFVAVLFVSLVLNWANLWPFTWRWTSSTTGAYAQLLVQQHEMLAIAMWAVTGIAVIPVLEEAVFRVGVLRGLSQWTTSSRFGIFASSLLFAAGHLGGPFWRPDAAHLVNSFWIFAGSLIIAFTTVRDAGNVSIALGSHVARNTIEFVLLLVAIGVAPS